MMMSAGLEEKGGIAMLATLGYGGLVFLLFAIFPKYPEIGIMLVGMPVVLFGTLIGQAFTPKAKREWMMCQYENLEDLRAT